MRTSIYVDGFNVYYRALKDTPYKWLNPLLLCENLLDQRNQFTRLRYFTATVTAHPWNPGQPERQRTYLRAVLTIPTAKVHYGHFLTHRVRRPLASNPRQMVEVLDTEEKGSDVNIATYLLRDGYRGRYDCAVVVSNDSDLVEPIRIVKDELQKPVLVLNPSPRKPAVALKNTASFFKDIRPNALGRSQFPDPVFDAAGRAIRKPHGW